MTDETMMEFEKRVGEVVRHLLATYRNADEPIRRAKLNQSLRQMAQEVRMFGPDRPSAADENTDSMETLRRLLIAGARQLVAAEVEARQALVDQIDPVLAKLVNRSSRPKAPTAG